MSGLEIAALVAATVWLGTMTFVVLLVVRQIGILTLAFNERAGTSAPFEDGPLIGAAVPSKTLAAVPHLADTRVYVLFLDDACSSCRMIATDLGNEPGLARQCGSLLVILPGEGPQAGGLASMLPALARVIRDPVATEVMRGFRVRSTPSLYQIEGGNITGRLAPVGSSRDLVDFVAARRESDAGEFAGSKEPKVGIYAPDIPNKEVPSGTS